MRFFALLALTCLVARVYTTSCASTMYCMGCSSTNVCDACFNWGSGSVGARSLASGTCTTALTKTMTDAKFYSGTHTNASNWCWCSAYCKDNKYFVVDKTSGVAANYTGSCTSTVPAGGVAVANCEYASFDKTSTTAATNYCVMCKKGYGGTSSYNSCAGTVIANCDYGTGANCMICKSDFAVSNAQNTCVAFTTDSNCRALAADLTCSDCWAAYYFNGATCKLFAGLMIASYGFAMIFNF